MDDSTVVAVAILGGLATIIAIAIIIWLLFVIAYWKIFKKAGIPGWKSIIPFYNSYCQYKFSWQTKYFWAEIGLMILGCIVVACGGYTATDINPLSAVVSAFQDGYTISGIGYILMLAGYLINAVSYYWLGRCFGYKWGFFILALIFPNIALLVLGFGSRKYLGDMGANAEFFDD